MLCNNVVKKDAGLVLHIFYPAQDHIYQSGGSVVTVKPMLYTFESLLIIPYKAPG